MRMMTISWFGCLAGASVMALMTTCAGLPAISGTILIAHHKLSFSFLQTFLRGILGSTLISLAIFMSKLNRDMVGKSIAIFFPISTYVICDFEHCLASMYFLINAKLNGGKFSIIDIIKFLIPSTLGNFVGSFIVVGLGLFSIPKKLKSSGTL